MSKKTPERSQCRRSGVSTVNFEHISHLSFSASIVDSKQVNVRWVMYYLSPPVVNSKHRYWMNGEFVYNPFGYNIDHSMTHFRLMFRFHTPRKHQKTRSFTDVFRVYRNGRLVWKLQHTWITNSVNKGRDHSFITYETFSEKSVFLTPWYTDIVCVTGVRNIRFLEIFCARFQMNDLMMIYWNITWHY